MPKNSYRFSTILIGLEKSKNGYSGWYNPKKEGTWKISLALSDDELKNIKSVIINGKESKYSTEKNHLYFYGEKKLNEPLSWEIKY